MSGTIVYRAAQGGENIILGGVSDYVAPLNIPPWTKLRVGIRASIQAEADITGMPICELALGLCHGTGYPYGSPGCQHFVGGYTYPTFFHYIHFDEQHPTRIQSDIVPGSFYMGKKLGTGHIYVGNSASGPVFAHSDEPPHTVLFVDITRGSPNFILDFFLCNAGSPALDWPVITEANFNVLVTQEFPSQLYHQKFSGYPVAVNETKNGVLDTVNLSWNRPTNLVRVEDLAVVDFSQS